jgi:hypothetical protein
VTYWQEFFIIINITALATDLFWLHSRIRLVTPSFLGVSNVAAGCFVYNWIPYYWCIIHHHHHQELCRIRSLKACCYKSKDGLGNHRHFGHSVILNLVIPSVGSRMPIVEYGLIPFFQNDFFNYVRCIRCSVNNVLDKINVFIVSTWVVYFY